MGWTTRLTVGIAAAAVLTGCAGTGSDTAATTTTAPTTDRKAAYDELFDRLDPLIDDIGNGFRWMGGAAQSLDMADLRASCRSLDATIDELEEVLPGPDRTVSVEIQGAVDEWRQMSRICQGASLRMDLDELDLLATHREAGMKHFEKVVELTKQGRAAVS